MNSSILKKFVLGMLLSIIVAVSVPATKTQAGVSNANYGAQIVGDDLIVVNTGDSVTLELTIDHPEDYTFEWKVTGTAKDDVQITDMQNKIIVSNLNGINTVSCNIRKSDSYKSDYASWSIYNSDYIKDKYKLSNDDICLFCENDDASASMRGIEMPSNIKRVIDPSVLEGSRILEVLNKVYPDVTFIIATSDIQRIMYPNYNLVNLDETGLIDHYQFAYPVIKEMGTFDQHLKFINFECSPAELLYDTDIAMDVLGTADANEISAMLNTPEKFLQVAAQMKAAGYSMTSGAAVTIDSNGGLLRTFTKSREYGILSENDKNVVNHLADEIIQNGYDRDQSTWSDKWYNDYKSGNAFCFFSCNWMDFILEASSSVHGTGICDAPFGYVYGGSFFCIKSGSKDDEAVAFLTKVLDEENLYKQSSISGMAVNHARVMNRLIQEKPEIRTQRVNGSASYEIWDRALRGMYGGNYVLPEDCTYVKPGNTPGTSENDQKVSMHIAFEIPYVGEEAKSLNNIHIEESDYEVYATLTEYTNENLDSYSGQVLLSDGYIETVYANYSPSAFESMAHVKLIKNLTAGNIYATRFNIVRKDRKPISDDFGAADIKVILNGKELTATYSKGIFESCDSYMVKGNNFIAANNPNPSPSVAPSTNPSVAPSTNPSVAPSTKPSATPSQPQTITVAKAVKKTVTLKASKLKKKKTTIKIGAKAKTALSYVVSKTPKNAKKYISVSKKGVITMKKGAKKGTYKVVITADADSQYAKATKTVTIKVK